MSRATDVSRGPVRHLWRRVALTVAAGVLGALAFGPLQPASGDEPRTSRASEAAKPTIVLIHGAFADASSWAPVTARLQDSGYHVVAPPNPLRGLTADATYIAAYLKQATTGPVVLVGHSYGGAVITNAALADPDVRALVYVDAFAPAEGEAVAQIIGNSASALNVPDPTTIFNFVAYPGAQGGDVDVYLKGDTFNRSFAQDVRPDVRAVLAAGQKPAAFVTNVQPSGPPAWKELPSWYVLGTEDKVIPPATQRAMAERAGSKITEVSSGHLPMITKSESVAKVIQEAARSIK